MVKRLSAATVARIQDQVLRQGRPLEAALIAYQLADGEGQDVLQALAPFQNEDGGFGHGMEPDFWLPESSPMATSLGVGVLMAVGVSPQEPLLQAAIRYYEATYQPQGQRWVAVGPAVAQHPHAPWWTYEPISPAETYPAWDGNPSATIVGQLLHYRSRVTRLDVEALVERALAYLQQQERYETHEIQCYLNLFEELSQPQKEMAKPILEKAIAQLIETDTRQWGDYVPKPLDFIKSPQSAFYEPFQNLVDTHLDYLVEQAETDGIWFPTWDWHGDDDNWQQARQQWIGVLAYNHLKALKGFGHIEG
jgi:hypothetical protein